MFKCAIDLKDVLWKIMVMDDDHVHLQITCYSIQEIWSPHEKYYLSSVKFFGDNKKISCYI